MLIDKVKINLDGLNCNNYLYTHMINSDFALGVHALLLLAAREGEYYASTALSELLNVHPVRIRKVPFPMKEGGFIDSKEGSSGGFTISCDISKVTLKSIYLLTQEDLLKPRCHSCCVTCR